MQFKQYYRPKLPRNKYGALTKNHLLRYTPSTSTFNLGNMSEEQNAVPINYEPFRQPIVFNEDEIEYAEGTEPIEPADIIIETETTPETE